MAIRKIIDGDVIIIPATADTLVRDVIEFGTNSIGVAQTAGLTGEDISVEIVGVYEFPATTAEAFVIGDIAKWDSNSGAMLAAGACTAGLIVSGKLAGVAGTIQVKIG